MIPQVFVKPVSIILTLYLPHDTMNQLLNFNDANMEKSLESRVAELERQIINAKEILSFEEASRFLNLSKSYLYKLTSNNMIPHYKPQGKMIYFERRELEAWLRRHPIKSRDQIESEAQSYLFERSTRNM